MPVPGDRGADRAGLEAALRSVFPSLDDAEQDALIAALEWVEVPGGASLFRQGEPGDSVYILVRGRLQVVLEDAEAGDERLLGEIAPGEAVGEIGLLTGEPRTATLWATRDSLLVRIAQGAFDRLVERNPSLLRQLARVVVDRLRERTSLQRFSPRVSNIALLPGRAKNGASGVAQCLARALAPHGATLHLCAETVDGALGTPGSALAAAGSAESARLAAWLAEQEQRHRFILYQADAEATQWTRRCLRQADLVVVIANASDDPTPVGAELELLGDAAAKRAVRRVLVLLHEGEKIQGTRRWLELRRVDEHHHVRGGEPADLERLARLLSGNGVGLVLGGGGARGFAHAGVYRALREAGIPIDWVGGSSIGAVFAAGIAMGWDPDRVEAEARRSFVDQNPFRDYTIPFVSLLRGRRLERLAQRSFDVDIEDIPIPYFCISSNLSNANVVVHERGSLWRAIRASVALPGVLPPAIEEHSLMIDGGILNNLPVDIMRERPVGKVIAVDLSVGKEYEFELPDVPGPLRILLSKLPFARRLHVPGIVTVIMKSAVIASALHASSVREEADLLLNPPVGPFGLLDTRGFDEIVEIGYRHAREQLEHWQG